MNVKKVTDSFIYSLTECYDYFYEAKDVVIGPKAAFFTIQIDGEEYDVSIKDASLREEYK